MSVKSRVRYFGFVAAAAILVAVSCSSGAEPTQAPAATPTTAVAGPTSTSPAPVASPAPAGNLIQIPEDIQQEMPLLAKYHWSKVDWSPATLGKGQRTSGGVLKMNQPTVPRTWDTATPFGSTVALISSPFYNRLLTYEMDLNKAYEGAGNIHKLFFKPDLAETWSISQDGLTYTFKLRQGVKWQNVPPVNGREFTADDVVYNINRFRDGQLSGATADIYKNVASVEATDKYTVVFKMKSVDGAFIYSIVGPLNNLVPKEAVDDGSINNMPIGTGAFIAKEYIANDHLYAEKNPNYFREGRPFLDRVEWYNIPDAAARIAAFRTGQLDEYTYRGWNDAKQLIDNCGALGCLFYVNEQNSGSNYYFGFNVKEKPFDDIRVRRAIAMSIDYNAAIKALYGGNARIGFSTVPTDWDGGRMFPRTAKDAPAWYKYNPEESKRLLKEAGYAPGSLKLKMLISSATGAMPSDPALYMEYLRAVGIETEPQLVDATTWRSKYNTGQWDDLLYGATITGGSDLNDWASVLETGAPSNIFGVSDSKLDELIRAQRVELDRAKREQIGKAIADYDYENLYGRVWLPSPLFYHFFRPWVQSLVGHDVYFWATYWGLNVLEDTWLDRTRMPAGVQR
ncbi:MAG: ABC transporter substrate-binding protein [Chloroflexi bacterium]|nr:ABC transporter substrate-binding protein [Chloroflexota bacterium]